MTLIIEVIEYFNVLVNNHVSDGSMLLENIANGGISFHAFKAISVDSKHTQFSLFPKNPIEMTTVAKNAGISILGQGFGLLIKGDEKTGALADIYKKLAKENIEVIESSGVADIKDGYGVLLYLRKEDCEKAKQALLK